MEWKIFKSQTAQLKMYCFHISCKGNIHLHYNFFFLCSFLSVCSLIDTSYLCLLHPLWLPPLFCHSGLGIQISLVHREHNSFPHPAVSLRLPFFPPTMFLNVTVYLVPAARQPVDSLAMHCVCLLRRECVLQSSPLPPSHLPWGAEPVHPRWRVLPQVCPQWRWEQSLISTYCVYLLHFFNLPSRPWCFPLVGFLFLIKT